MSRKKIITEKKFGFPELSSIIDNIMNKPIEIKMILKNVDKNNVKCQEFYLFSLIKKNNE